MENFVYIAQDLAGSERRGVKRSISANDVYAWLHEHNLIPVEVKSAESAAVVVKNQSYGNKRIKYADTAAFCWQLAIMLEGGITITEAIDTIAEDIEKTAFKYTLMDISEQIKTGETFYSSISKFPKVFNRLFCAMTLAGETSGSLPLILRRLAEYYTNRDKFAKKTKTAMAYPAFLMAFVFVMMIVITTVIIPRFRTLFDDMGENLPAFTQSFLGIYDTAINNAPAIIIISVSLIMTLVIYNKTSQGHSTICRLILRIPLFGKLMTESFIATFCKTMATLLAAGVSIVEAMDILSDMTNNNSIRQAVLHSKERIIEGSGVALGMATSGFFPSMVSRMAQVGEKSGELPKVLERASDYYESKMEATISTLLSLLGPAVIVLIGGLVLAVVVALYLPIFTMSDAIR